MFTKNNYNLIMALAVLLILVIPVGVANVILGYIVNESPCTLCWWQRIAMILVGVMGIFILRYGPRLKYIIMVYLCAMGGMFMSIRHTSGHSRGDIGQGFGGAVFGVHTYTWGVFVFFMVIIVISLLSIFCLYNEELKEELISKKKVLNSFNTFTQGVVVVSLLVVASNAFQAFFTNGIPPFTGKGDPERMTLNLGRAASMWTTHYWSPLAKTWGLRGSYNIPLPYVAGDSDIKNFSFDMDPKNSIFKSDGSLKLIKSFALDLKIKGDLRGLGYDAATGGYGIVTSANSIYLVDKDFKKINYFADVAVANGGSDIGTVVDATFTGKNEFLITGMSKTLTGVKVVDNPPKDDYMHWRSFYEASANLQPYFGIDYPKLHTVRAKKSYILAMAKDPDDKYFYMINVTHKYSKKLILMKFDLEDQALTSEFKIFALPKLQAKGDVNKLYITSMTFSKGKILAISKNYNILLVIDKNNGEIQASYALPELGDIDSIVANDEGILIAAKKDGKTMLNLVNNPL